MRAQNRTDGSLYKGSTRIVFSQKADDNVLSLSVSMLSATDKDLCGMELPHKFQAQAMTLSLFTAI